MYPLFYGDQSEKTIRKLSTRYSVSFDDWLVHLTPSPHLLTSLAQRTNSRSLYPQNLPPIQTPSKTHALVRPGEGPKVLPFVHLRIWALHCPFSTHRPIKVSSAGDCARWDLYSATREESMGLFFVGEQRQFNGISLFSV